MELVKSRKENSTLRLSNAYSVEVPEEYSRQKAIRHASEEGMNPIPGSGARRQLYLLLMKIGATGELPKHEDHQKSYLNDFWLTLYLRNNLCPGDIPFPIIINEFTIALVQGVVDRKGNNQAAICQAFNKWITRQDIRHHLYMIRNRMYPEHKPKEISKSATPGTVADYSDEELSNKLNSIKRLAGLKMADMMIEELENEIKRRSELST